METLLTLSEDPMLLTLDSIHMASLERWTVVMYSKSSGCSRVNDVRRQLFTHGTRTLDHIPPTQEALLQHAKQALYQAGSIWRQARQRHQDVPDASAWSWTQDVNTKLWVLFWTVLYDTSKACALRHHCGCGKACRGNCKCARAGIKCTILCNCEGWCINNDGV